MANIVLDGTKIKVYGMLAQLCEYCNEKPEWQDELWSYLLRFENLYDEFVYYLEHHTIQGNMSVDGYTLLDLYVKQIDLYNIKSDLGKNPSFCNKEDMVLNAFMMMGKMIDDPEKYKKQMQDGFGMDTL